MKLNIATLITLIAVVDHSPYRVLATAKTSEYETETISKQEDDAVSVLPLLRGVKKAVNQFLSDSDSEELSCLQEDQACLHHGDCCGYGICEDGHCWCANNDRDLGLCKCDNPPCKETAVWLPSLLSTIWVMLAVSSVWHWYKNVLTAEGGRVTSQWVGRLLLCDSPAISLI